MRRLSFATVTAVLLLAGCTAGEGSDGTKAAPTPDEVGSTTVTPSTSSAPAPDCDEVWRAGATLPARYTTCLDDGQVTSPDSTACTDGNSLVVHLDTFYAVTGQKIAEPDVAPLQDTDEFGQAYETCTGE